MSSAEQKRANANVAIIGLFLTAIYVPLFGSLLMEDKSTSAVERRGLAPLPPLPNSTDAMKKFPRAFEQYFDDHFGFRENLVWIYNRAKYGLGDSPTKSVLRGKDGWLFYADQQDGDPIGDFRNINLFTPQQLAQVRAALLARYRWLKARGIEYVFVIAPNKHSIYPEYLPDYLPKVGKKSAYDQLVESLRHEPAVPVIDLRPALLEAKKNHVVYSKIGTHWNQYGANIAQYEITKHLAQKFNVIQPTVWTAENYDWAANENYRGLARMMGLADQLAISGPSYAGPPLRARKIPAQTENIRAPFMTLCDTSKLDVVVFRDSFFTAMQPYFSEHFHRVTYVWSMPSLIDLKNYVRNRHPDIVVEQRVERYLNVRVVLPVRTDP